VVVTFVVVLVGYLRMVDTCISREAASGWRVFDGDAMCWGMLVVFFLSLEFSEGLLFLLVCGFALLVFVEVCTLVSLSLRLDLFTCCGRLVVFRCGVGSVCCSCGFCVVPVRNPLVWWSYG
jgi:hypothetical protein